ncbi:hypothetical protein LEP3755_32550 [Leptolyngbya sp. NIES-3755]|nr:hypothetical protein LEP3755_32550 [Leptolyngbya sp. NIES-3755]
MAFFYSLSVECGTDESAASMCAKHFDGWKLPLDNLSPDTVTVTVKQDSSDENNWWVVVVPDGVSRSGVYSEEVARSMSASGHCLLDHLKTSPPFRFAVIGVEADEAIYYSDLVEELGEDPTFAERYQGLVISEEIYNRISATSMLESFAPGRFWIPYRGETYRLSVTN